MLSETFDRETLLDLIVNAIPLAMMAFFIVVFALFNPFGSDPASTAIQFSIVVVTFGALFVLTYYSGKAISNAEKELEADPSEFAEPEAAAANPDPDAEYADSATEQHDSFEGDEAGTEDSPE